MMKQLKKFVLTLTATLALALLAAASSASTLLPLPSVTTGQEDIEPTPLLEEPDIQPLADDDDEIDITKTF